MSRDVTERDFRQPEFINAEVKDYERRDDGKIVRKDRWEQGMHSVAMSLGLNSRSGFEINDVIAAVRDLRNKADPERICSDEQNCGAHHRVSGLIDGLCPDCKSPVAPRETN